MKICLLSVFLFGFCFRSSSQGSMCGTAPEGGTVTLTAPAGNVFTSVTFASYGTPNGSCGAFTIGSCHAANSVSVVQGLIIGNNSASIPATNATFGDPCVGTGKRLYIEAVYSSALPLKLVSFSGTALASANLLNWETTNEIDTKEFQIERSNDGSHFSVIGTVAAINRPGNNSYSFSDNLLQAPVQFYRLKMIDIDGAFVYSNIIKLEISSSNRFTVFPNPVTNSITVSGLQSKGLIEISDILGRIVQKVTVIGQAQTINVEGYLKGLYLIKYSYDDTMICEKIVKE
mgnify:FL=1